MNAIIGMTKIADTTDHIDRLKYCLNMISSSSAHLLGIINDVLDMSEIDTGRFELENVPLSIRNTLKKVSGAVHDMVESKKQAFEVRIGDGMSHSYIADDLRLTQVLSNLLSNAIKFTPEGGKITLSADVAGQNETTDSIRFTISDTGIGMSADQQRRLFSAFEQADGGASRRYGGTGLGLAISQSIVERMGGKIRVESTPGAGSVFIFDVDLERASVPGDGAQGSGDSGKPESSGKAADSVSAVPDLSSIRILLVDDVDINREIFIALLEDTGISIDVAENGLDAIGKLKESPGKYDLIIMDIQMPVMDGFQATRLIRDMDFPNAKTIPIIAMTANALKEDVNRCIECGMDDHLAKPIDEKSVIGKIRQYTMA